MEWKDLTIRQYQNVCRELNEKYDDELEKSIGLLSSITGVPTSVYLEETPINELKKILKGISFLSTPIPKVKLKSKVKIGNRRFRFNLNMRTITAGGYIDLTELVKDRTKINDNLHTILAVLCHEVNFWGKKKDSDPLEIAQYFLDNLTVPMVVSYSGFFLSNYQRLIKGTLVYLDKEKKRMRKTSQEAINQALLSIGDGTIL